MRRFIYNESDCNGNDVRVMVTDKKEQEHDHD